MKNKGQEASIPFLVLAHFLAAFFVVFAIRNTNKCNTKTKSTIIINIYVYVFGKHFYAKWHTTV